MRLNTLQNSMGVERHIQLNNHKKNPVGLLLNLVGDWWYTRTLWMHTRTCQYWCIQASNKDMQNVELSAVPHDRLPPHSPSRRWRNTWISRAHSVEWSGCLSSAVSTDRSFAIGTLALWKWPSYGVSPPQARHPAEEDNAAIPEHVLSPVQQQTTRQESGSIN